MKHACGIRERRFGLWWQNLERKIPLAKPRHKEKNRIEGYERNRLDGQPLE
jgi:hypothetical protein